MHSERPLQNSAGGTLMDSLQLVYLKGIVDFLQLRNFVLEARNKVSLLLTTSQCSCSEMLRQSHKNNSSEETNKYAPTFQCTSTAYG